MNNFKTTIAFIYTPETANHFNTDEIFDAASDYLCRMVEDFYGFGESDNFKVTQIYTGGSRHDALVSFQSEIATKDFDELERISETFENLGEI